MFKKRHYNNAVLAGLVFEHFTDNELKCDEDIVEKISKTIA